MTPEDRSKFLIVSLDGEVDVPPANLEQRYRKAQNFDEIKTQPEIDEESRGVPAWCVFGVIAVLILACILLLLLLGSLFITGIDALGDLLGG